MAVATKFNGTTVSFAASGLIPLLSLSYDATSAEVDVTGAGDSLHTFEPGIPNETLVVELVGTSTKTVGDLGATVVTWGGVAGNTWGSWSSAVITKIEKTGRIDDKETYSITIKRVV